MPRGLGLGLRGSIPLTVSIAGDAAYGSCTCIGVPAQSTQPDILVPDFLIDFDITEHT